MKTILVTIQRTDSDEKEYAGGILAVGGKILNESDSANRKIVLWINQDQPFFLNEDVANDVLEIIQKTAKGGTSFEVTKYNATLEEVEKKTFKQERCWEI